ncbi:sterol carrier family protein [Micromonospora sp. WMMD1102]|uniref:sterol carrier family protein n=1 Tax=Micromonospora sp. WMMD1102 TaxID=3016105 RepID=UPI0024152654|nr:sterol carrier family protein [Micromonospora sp. WMMD1102]MDG4790720.1 sterol carrier family protein [Micromonospora sp. WMMD1102]
MSSPHNKSPAVATVLADLDAGRTPERTTLRDAVRVLLADLARAAPGRAVEVRVPPYGAVQCCAGPRHTRGTPPNVVEMAPEDWLRLASGRISWAEAVTEGLVRTSGNRADISPYLPI